MARIRDPELLRRLHLTWRTCVLCGKVWPLSLEHVYPRSQGGDDVEANLVMLCGDGVSGCHGLMEAEDEETRFALGTYLHASRPDTIAYIVEKVPHGGGWAWLERRLFVPDTSNLSL